jgi:hypothetical protein
MGIEVRRIDIQLHHLIKPCPGSFQAFLEISENLARLRFDVPFPDDTSLFIHCGLSGNVNLVSDLHHLGESGTRIPKSYGLDNFSGHFFLLFCYG